MTSGREDTDRYYSDSGPRKPAAGEVVTALRKLFVKLPFFVTSRGVHPSDRVGKMLRVAQSIRIVGPPLVPVPLVIKSKHSEVAFQIRERNGACYRTTERKAAR
jgi:hypothetical protein